MLFINSSTYPDNLPEKPVQHIKISITRIYGFSFIRFKLVREQNIA